MTFEERVNAVEQLGFSAPQAEFLTLVALHSGYFLRRQHPAFLQRPRGEASTLFMRRLRDEQWVRAWRTPDRQHLFHLIARPVYRAVGDEHNRHRKRRPLRAIVSKLMALDFVLLHRACTFFPTERDKVHEFRDVHGVDVHALPTTVYRSPTDRAVPTARYFVEKQPVYRTPSGALRFAFVDADGAPAAGLAEFVARHRALWAALPAPLGLVFVTTSAARAAHGRAVFDAQARPGVGVSARMLLAHFQTRAALASGRVDGVAAPDLAAFQRVRKGADRVVIEGLYAAWCAYGDVAVRQALEPEPVAPLTFETIVLPFRYPVPVGVSLGRPPHPTGAR